MKFFITFVLYLGFGDFVDCLRPYLNCVLAESCTLLLIGDREVICSGLKSLMVFSLHIGEVFQIKILVSSCGCFFCVRGLIYLLLVDDFLSCLMLLICSNKLERFSLCVVIIQNRVPPNMVVSEFALIC